MELHISGEVLGASDFPSSSATHCHWVLEAGTDWRVLQGVTEGHSQTDCKVCPEGMSTWASPFDVHYASSSLLGWPKLRVEMYVQDAHGRSDIAGYGFCYVPSAPGEHSTDIVLWRPAGNGMEQLRAYFLGAHPKLQDPTVASHEGDRFELQTSTTGRVHVRFQVMLRGAADHGLTLS